MSEWFFDILPFLCTGLALFLLVRSAGNTNSRPQNNRQAPTRQATPEQTGPIIYFATNDFGLSDREYRFDYRKEQGFWKAYILRMPSLRGRSGSFHITHRLGAADAPFVCWDRPLRTLEDAQTVSRVWADHLQEYIATGKRF